MTLVIQRRMAAAILKCGKNSVWFDPERTKDLSDAVTRGDIRKLIVSGAIAAHQARGVSRGRARKRAAKKAQGRRRGVGSRRGTALARSPKKVRWMQTIRPIRKKLRELRSEGKIDRHTYRHLYGRAHGGMFKSTAHLLQQIKTKDTGRTKAKSVAKMPVPKKGGGE